MLTLNVTDPPTPRLSPEDRARLQMKRASSMIQVKESCDSLLPKYVETGVELGAGHGKKLPYSSSFLFCF